MLRGKLCWLKFFLPHRRIGNIGFRIEYFEVTDQLCENLCFLSSYVVKKTSGNDTVTGIFFAGTIFRCGATDVFFHLL
jgi:hypothetical protein